MKGYTSISLKKNLSDRIQTEAANNGFSSIAEFIRFCVFKEIGRKKQ